MKHSLAFSSAAVAALLLAGCVPAAIAGGAVVVGIGSAIVFSNCDEPASVRVWDHTSAYPICDATVVAVSETGTTVTFSPCYSAYLGSGTWNVTASKAGLPVARGTVTVAEDHRCSQPTFHSLDLTLGSDGTVTAPAPAVPAAPAPPPPVPQPPPAAPEAGPTAAPPSLPGAAPAPAPSSSVPAAAFPTQTASPDVPAPPTR